MISQIIRVVHCVPTFNIWVSYCTQAAIKQGCKSRLTFLNSVQSVTWWHAVNDAVQLKATLVSVAKWGKTTQSVDCTNWISHVHVCACVTGLQHVQCTDSVIMPKVSPLSVGSRTQNADLEFQQNLRRTLDKMRSNFLTFFPHSAATGFCLPRLKYHEVCVNYCIGGHACV